MAVERIYDKLKDKFIAGCGYLGGEIKDLEYSSICNLPKLGSRVFFSRVAHTIMLEKGSDGFEFKDVKDIKIIGSNMRISNNENGFMDIGHSRVKIKTDSVEINKLIS